LVPDNIFVQPLVFIDFSLNNIIDEKSGTNMHTGDERKQNQYRDVLEMICHNIYSSEIFMPIFGYGAKTYPGSFEASQLFPMNMKIGNPLIINDQETIQEMYAECLDRIEPASEVKLY
jgi:hypothetical protein